MRNPARSRTPSRAVVIFAGNHIDRRLAAERAGVSCLAPLRVEKIIGAVVAKHQLIRLVVLVAHVDATTDSGSAGYLPLQVMRVERPGIGKAAGDDDHKRGQRTDHNRIDERLQQSDKALGHWLLCFCRRMSDRC